jgi:hypothetical protein
MRYRNKDKREINQFGQELGYAICFGGPSLTYVKGIVCQDGSKRIYHKTGEPDTYFSMPGYVTVKGNKVKGYLTCDNITEEYKFIVYVNEKNSYLITGIENNVTTLFKKTVVASVDYF